MTQTCFFDCPRPSQIFPWQKDEMCSHNRKVPSQLYMCTVPKCSHEPPLRVPETITWSAKKTFREITEEKYIYMYALHIHIYLCVHTQKKPTSVLHVWLLYFYFSNWVSIPSVYLINYKELCAFWLMKKNDHSWIVTANLFLDYWNKKEALQTPPPSNQTKTQNNNQDYWQRWFK